MIWPLMILISDLSSHEQIYIKDVYFDIDKHLHSPMSYKKLHIKVVKIDLLRYFSAEQ